MTAHPPLLHLIHTGDAELGLIHGYAWVATTPPEARRMLDGHRKTVQARAANHRPPTAQARCLHIHITDLPALLADPGTADRVSYLVANGAAYGIQLYTVTLDSGQPTTPRPITPGRITTITEGDQQ